MFGYVTVFKPELKIKEYEAYKGIYCTLCKELGKEYGFLSRFLLSYDGAFYIMFKMSLKEQTPCINSSRCSFNPAKKCLHIDFKNDIYKLSASIVILLAYFKIIDNINDSSILKKLLFYCILPYFSIKKNKAKKLFPDIYEYIENGMKRQFETEKDDNYSLDLAADSTANMLSFLFSYGEQGVSYDFSKRFGYCLGRTVYFLDAFDDYEDDMKKGCYNPFSKSKNLIDDAVVSVNLSVGELSALLSNNQIYEFKEIIDNVVYEGLNYQLQKIIKKYRGDDNK